MFRCRSLQCARQSVVLALSISPALAMLWLLSSIIVPVGTLPFGPASDLLTPATPLAPNAILTATNANDDGPGSLRQTIADAVDGDIITFDNNYAIYLSSTLVITKQLTIDGGTYTVTVSGDSLNDGSRNVQVFSIDSTSVVTLSHLNIISGTASEGGGIFNDGALIVIDCKFIGNSADGGGGIFNNSGNVTIQDSTFLSNSTGSGGGILNLNGILTATHIFLSNNVASFEGGAIYNVQGTLLLQGSTIYSNAAGYGGGLSSYWSTARIQNSSLLRNSATYGGGGIYYDVGTLIVQTSTFQRNSATDGGGVFVSRYGVLTVTESTLLGNSATRYGGGILNYGRLGIENSGFADNSAVDGGAIKYSGPIMTMISSTISNNSASNNGGGIYIYSDNTTMGNNTFLENSAANSGGGIYNGNQLMIWNSTFFSNTATSFGGGVFDGWNAPMWNNTFSGNSANAGGGLYRNTDGLQLHNTIIANSPTGGDCVNNGRVFYNVHNLIEDNTCSPAYSGDPGLGPLHDNGGSTWTMALLPGSLAIDAGNDATCMPTDQRGIYRPQGVHCDIGAYEATFITYRVYVPLIFR
jgi:parallel beta-helix repeat protein